mgnify:CR=1 FL=1
MNKIYNTSHVLLLTAILLLTAACSSDSSNDVQTTNNQQEISLVPTVWQMMEGTRATTYGSVTDLQNEGSFTCQIYKHDTNTLYNPSVTVTWSAPKWIFSDGKHYWPAEGSLDFFAYIPATKPNYITSEPTYSVQSSTPQASFTCANIPMTYNATNPTAGQGSSLQEFIWGITIGQNKTNQGESGVTMKFRHPFARLRFQLAASHPNIIINSITFKNLKTGGTCTLNNTDIDATYYYKTSEWSDLTGSSNLVMTLVSKDNDGNFVMTDANGNIIVDNAAKFYSNPASVIPIGGYSGVMHQYIDLLVIPQTFAGEIEVNAGWNDWGDSPVAHTVSKTISAITWQPGKTYTYTFTISTDDLTVDINSYTEQW